MYYFLDDSRSTTHLGALLIVDPAAALATSENAEPGDAGSEASDAARRASRQSTLDYAGLVSLVENRLQLIPRYRQVVREVTLGLARPVWVDDPDFDILRVTSRPYMFTASLPPSVIAATTEALRQLRTRPALRRRLLDNAGRLYVGLAGLGFSLGPEPNPVVSAIMPSPEAAFAFWTKLLEAGLYTNVSLPPATPKGLALLRTSVSAAHTPEQIDHAVALFARVGQEMGLIEAVPAAMAMAQ